MSSQAQKKKILIVDEKNICTGLQAALDAGGFATVAKANGRDALDMVLSHSVDVVVSDTEGIDGFEGGVDLLSKMKQTEGDVIPFVLISSLSDISVEEALSKGAHAVFMKPAKPDDVIRAINRSLAPVDIKWRRNADRIPMKKSIQLSIPDFDQSRISHTSNIGRGGAFIVMSKDFPPLGTKMTFALDFEGMIIRGAGICRWVRRKRESREMPSGIGIEFLELDDESINYIREYLDENDTVAFIPNM